MNTTETTTIEINLGFIGHKAEKFQNLFSAYTTEPNEYGYFLKFENYSHLEPNTDENKLYKNQISFAKKGVNVLTNCWDSEEDFKKDLMNKLLFDF